MLTDQCDVVAEIDHLIHECIVPYTYAAEEKGDFGTNWNPIWNNGTHTNAREEFKYRTPKELNGWPYWAIHGLYDGGGYTVIKLTIEALTLNNLPTFVLFFPRFYFNSTIIVSYYHKNEHNFTIYICLQLDICMLKHTRVLRIPMGLKIT